MNIGAALTMVGSVGLILLLIAGALLGRRNPPPPTVEPDGDPDLLCYCEGCGCRHRQFNMEWKPNGAFRCWVCCLDYDAAIRRMEGRG